MKKVLGLYNAPRQHWVGDGFPVRSLFSYSSHGAAVSPFLLLDYASPTHFPPSKRPRGVGEHPHRGFETVTIVYQGEVEHRDTSGGGGKIGPGDVQWMTAASGIQHDEFHSRAFSETGGTMEMVQLWVNLPAAHKMSPPRYQTLLNAEIPVVALPNEAGTLRVIAGSFQGHAGPALTFTPVDVWDLRVKADKTVSLQIAEGRTLALVVLHGQVQLGSGELAGESQLVLLSREGSEVQLRASTDATVLVLSGEPIDEPIVGHGPFVMNTQAEIVQAVRDFQSGRFGRLGA